MAVSNNESEERYPLLFLYLEDAKGNNRGYRKMFSGKGNARSGDISSGATAVIAQWPGHLASCWLASLLCGLTLLVLALLLFATTSRPPLHSLNSRCIGSHIFDDKRLDNETLHLVHDSYLWSQPQVDTLDEIVRSFRNHKVHLVTIVSMNSTTPTIDDATVEDTTVADEDVGNESTTVAPKRSKRSSKLVMVHGRKFKKRSKKHAPTAKKQKSKGNFDINIGTKNLLMVLLRNRKHFAATTTTSTTVESTTTECAHRPDISDLIKKHPDVLVDMLTYEDVFFNSPLHDSWTKLNKDTRLFAVRILYLWQFGGISYALPDQEGNSTENNKNMGKLIASGYGGFKGLPRGIVTIDDQGLHMQTKTSCHAFFGEMLTKLRNSDEKTTVEQVIKDTLKVFCKRGAVDSGYCANLKS